MIDRNSKNAAKFVVVAERRIAPRTEQDVGTIELKTFVFDPSASIGQLFEKLFEGPAALLMSTEFARVSIYPDENSLPVDELLSSLSGLSSKDVGADDIFGTQSEKEK